MLESVRAVVDPVLNGLSLKIVEIEYKDAGPRSVLRIFIDKPGGVTIDDCVEASRRINVRLDVEDLIPHRYTLEVSSPGLTRKLKTAKDFTDSIGRHVRIVTKKTCYVGKLNEFRDGTAEIVGKKGQNRVRFDEIEKANLELDPDVLSGPSKKTRRGE